MDERHHNMGSEHADTAQMYSAPYLTGCPDGSQ